MEEQTLLAPVVLFLFGLVLGVLVTFLLDFFVFGWQAALHRVRELEERVQTAERNLGVARRRAQVLTEDWEANQTEMDHLRAENEVLEDNLNRMSRRLDRLDAELEKAESESDALQDTLEMLHLDKPQGTQPDEVAEVDLTAQFVPQSSLTDSAPDGQQALSEAELQPTLAEDMHGKTLSADVVEAAVRGVGPIVESLVDENEVVSEADVDMLMAENESLQQKLGMAERRVRQLNAQVFGALQQLTQNANSTTTLGGSRIAVKNNRN